MNIKKIIAGTMAVALTAAVSVGGTLAYLMDTDEDVNVMTLGDVYIDQIEQERVDDKDNQTDLKDFEQNQPLLPAVYPGSSIPWAPENEWVDPGNQAWKVVQDNTNVIDKFVTVKNTGKSDAYVRTIFAIEVGKDGVNDPYVHIVTNSTNIQDAATWTWDWIDGIVQIGDGYYQLGVATYTEALKPGATTIPSLKQIYLDKVATNENVEVYGDTFEILVFSQAVQTEGFDSIIVGPKAALNEAFGEVTLTANPWLNKESNFAPASKDLKDAVTAGGDVTLSKDVTITDDSAAAKVVANTDTAINFSTKTLTLDNPNATPATENWIGVEVLGGNVVFDATTGGITTSANSDLFCSYVRNGATLTINGGNYIGGGSCVQVREGTLIVNGGYFEVNNPEADYRYVLNCTDANYKNGTAKIIIKGGSFLNWNPVNNPAEGAGTNFLADGYKVVEETVANGTLYTVVPV